MDQYLMQNLQDFIKQPKMDFKQLNSILCVIKKGILWLLLKQKPVIHLVGSLLWVGIQLWMSTKWTLNPSYSQLISKQNILLLKIFSMLYVAIHNMVLYLEAAIPFVYMKTQIRQIPIMLEQVAHTTSHKLQMVIQY